MASEPAPRPRWRVWAGRAGFALLLAVVFFGVRFYQQRSLVEGPAPVMRAALLDGQVFDLVSQRGEPLLVYFWASWCPVCRLEQGAIAALTRDHRVVTIAMQSGSNAEVTKYLREQGHHRRIRHPPDSGDLRRLLEYRSTARPSTGAATRSTQFRLGAIAGHAAGARSCRLAAPGILCKRRAGFLRP